MVSRDLLNRIVKVTDHDGKTVEYGWDAVGNKTVQGYPDGSQVDYYYDAENQIVEVVDFDGGITKYEYDANGNKTFKEYPNYETAYYFYDACDQIIEMDEYDLGGKKLFKTTYSWDAEGNRLSEMQYNHGQSSGRSLLEAEEPDIETQAESETEKKSVFESIGDWVQGLFNGEETEAPSAQLAEPDSESLGTNESIVNGVEVEEPAVRLGLGLSVIHEAEDAEDVYSSLMGQLSVAEEINDANTADVAETEDTVSAEENAATDNSENDEDSNKPETGKDDATIEGNGDGNGQVPPGQEEDEDGNIVNPGGNMPPGLNRGEKKEKPDNPNKPEKPENPGTEDSSDKQANKANKGTHLYGYDELNRMTSSNIANVETAYTYDTLGNLVLEETKNRVVDYQYNELNQLTSKKDGNESYTYTYDKRGNRIAETGKKESRTYVYDETNRMVEGTNWKGDKSSYIYNGLGIRINNTQTTHAGQVYSRDYVIDYTSYENDDLMVFAYSGEAVEYEQKQVYAGSERIEQFTDKGSWERLLYVHEDIMGNTRYYTKANGQSYAELTYDAWGTPVSPNKLLNNDHGNFVYATFTGHIYDTTLDIYFAEARFYDAANRTWMSVDPIKDGLNWYQYTYSNPVIYMDADGRFVFSVVAVGGILGAATGLVSNLIEQATDNKEFSVGELITKTVAGAATGALGSLGVTTGVGALGVMIGSAVIDTGAEVVSSNMIRGEAFDAKETAITAVSSFISTGVSFGISAGLGKVAGKWFPTRYETTTSLYRPTKDEAFDAAWKAIRVGGAGSYEWGIFGTELFEQLGTRIGRAALDAGLNSIIEKGADMISNSDIFQKLSGSDNKS